MKYSIIVGYFFQEKNKKGIKIMEEFMRLIYKNWTRCEEREGDISWEGYNEAVEEIGKYLSAGIAEEIEKKINTEVWKIEERAFIAGFAYASQCISHGKVEIGGGMNGRP